MENYVKKVSSVVQTASLPTIVSICIANCDGLSSDLLNVVWKQNNYEISKARQFITSYTFDCKEGIKNIPMFPVSTKCATLERVSPSRKLKACIRKQENATTKKEEFILDIGSENKLSQIINLSSYDKHGPIYSDPYFSELQWSQNEKKLVYVAEKKKLKNVGFFERQPPKKESEAFEKEDDSKTIGEKFNYEESWGEMLSDITKTVLVMVDLETETVEVISDIPDDICPAQPQWINEDTLMFTGYDTKPFRLGLRVCECRPVKIYTVSLKEEKNEVKMLCSSDLGVSDHSARVSHCKEKIVFIRRQLKPDGNSHRGNELLVLYNICEDSSKVIFGEEALLFTHDLTSNCWLSDNCHVVVPNDVDGLKYAMVIDTQTGTVKERIQCNALYNVESDFIFMVNNELDSEGASLKIALFNDGKINVYEEALKKNEDVECGKLIDDHGVVSFFVAPKNADKPYPLVVIPHGGPHVMCSNNFRRDAAVFAQLGYAVLLCNYRGSTGFTTSVLDSLIGNVGDIDIKDIHNFVEMFIGQQGDSVNTKQIYIYGGSHGGFIGAHLVGQYPEFYCAAALINPVIDIASMMMVTDIPDWTFLECGIPYTQGCIPSEEIYSKMVQKSPIIYLKDIKAPVILCIGGKDLRVPPSQGKSFYRLLQANNKVAKLLYYPEDSHPLMSIETDGDFFVNVCKWFYVHKRE